jgi:putative phosphoserine phosphatase / 1-acylglycerol-3-phosphate O-acyltransferase
MSTSELNRWWSAVSAVSNVAMRTVFRVSVEGAANVPIQGPAIVAFNHVSVIDGPAVGIVVARTRRRESRFLVAAEVFDQRVAGWILRSFDQIPIRRGQGDSDALEEAVRTVSGGAIAAIAPEGRVNDDGATEMLRFHRGVARLALWTAAPVIPVGIWGTQVRWSKTGRHYGKPWRPRLAFVLGEAVAPSGDPTDPDDLAAFIQRVREAIEVQVARARALTETT